MRRRLLAAVTLTALVAACGDEGGVASRPSSTTTTTTTAEALSVRAEGNALTVLSGSETVAELTIPDSDVAPGGDVDAADVTGDGEVDFLVRLLAADNIPGVVVSEDGGDWRLVPGDDGVVFARDAAFVDGRLRTFVNDCTPSCAEGTTTPVDWRYDGAMGRFTPA